MGELGFGINMHLAPSVFALLTFLLLANAGAEEIPSCAITILRINDFFVGKGRKGRAYKINVKR